MSAPEKRTGPLAGVKIVDMSSVVLGPFATLIFGDLGADVIKIEAGQKGKAGDMMRYAGASPTGDLGPIYTSLNRNKKSVQLDAKTEDGRDPGIAEGRRRVFPQCPTCRHGPPRARL